MIPCGNPALACPLWRGRRPKWWSRGESNPGPRTFQREIYERVPVTLWQDVPCSLQPMTGSPGHLVPRLGYIASADTPFGYESRGDSSIAALGGSAHGRRRHRGDHVGWQLNIAVGVCVVILVLAPSYSRDARTDDQLRLAFSLPDILVDTWSTPCSFGPFVPQRDPCKKLEPLSQAGLEPAYRRLRLRAQPLSTSSFGSGLRPVLRDWLEGLKTGEQPPAILLLPVSRDTTTRPTKVWNRFPSRIRTCASGLRDRRAT